jgi:hypothetical protein
MQLGRVGDLGQLIVDLIGNPTSFLFLGDQEAAHQVLELLLTRRQFLLGLLRLGPGQLLSSLGSLGSPVGRAECRRQPADDERRESVTGTAKAMATKPGPRPSYQALMPTAAKKRMNGAVGPTSWVYPSVKTSASALEQSARL